MADVLDFCHPSLDEFAEMGDKNLEALRQPLEDRGITISRAQGSLTFPANFISLQPLIPALMDL